MRLYTQVPDSQKELPFNKANKNSEPCTSAEGNESKTTDLTTACDKQTKQILFAGS